MLLPYKGTQISYEDTGKGSCIVLLHGFLCSSFIWSDLCSVLKRRYRVITIDLLGHGKTGCISYIHTMEAMAEGVKKVLKHLKIRGVTLVGHSMGGYVAMAFAEKYIDEINGLILINTTASEDSEERKANRDRAILMVKKQPQDFIRLSITNLFRQKNKRIFSAEIDMLKKEALKTPLQGIFAALEGMKIRKNRNALLHSTSFPKMLILGEKDPIVDYKTIKKQLLHTDVKTIILPDGHMSIIENKNSIVKHIKFFVEAI